MNPEAGVEGKLGLNRPAAADAHRLRLVVAYCGTPWRGWQSQQSGDGIQDQLRQAFAKAISVKTQVQGSGRTDAGVHARAQVAHCDVPCDVQLSPDSWRDALNACLPLSIRILEAAPCAADFHARFDARGKRYAYRIWRQRLLDPFEADRAWHLYGALDEDLLAQGLELLRGRHNFVRLSANRGDMPEVQRRANPEKTTREIWHSGMSQQGAVLELAFEGDGFLYKMVRMMVGSLLHVARGRAPLDWLAEMLQNREGLQSNQTAPAGGLYLERVFY